MEKCIELAKLGEGKTSPNPLVGCVVLDKDGKEISVGYHEKYGEGHAEANALNNLNLGDAKDGTLIVSLEPCSHYGKTPPCADLIIKHGLKQVVIGMRDPNPLISGEGVEKCKNAGIEVVEDVLKDEVTKLNEIFIKNMNEKSIYVALKTATTLDGKIGTKTGSSRWITSAPAREEVHRIRNRYDAILTTSSTVIKDNPSMTCRLENGKNPIKVIIDRDLRTDFTSKIYTPSGEKIYVVVDKNIEQKRLIHVPKHVDIIKAPVIDSKIDINFLLKELYNLKIMSVVVEAGGKFNGEIVSLGLVDKIYQFIAPKILADNTGISAYDGRDIEEISESIDFELDCVKMFHPDIMLTLYKKKPS